MDLREGYISAALRLLELAKAEPVSVTEAGARNSKSDLALLQSIHDGATALGANCGAEEMAESAKPEARPLVLVESSAFSADITIREALSPGRQIKLIAPGKGSTAYYTVEALKQAARDKIFHAGLPMRIDHPTRAEESARPEGSVKDWGAVLESDAIYRDDLPTGPGLYSSIKPFSDHATTITEKGPYAGVSIRANGNAVVESGKPMMREGVPVLKEFTSAEGADMVTRAGAGGMFLSESARPADIPIQEAAGMTADEVKKLVEAEMRVARLPGDAEKEAYRLLETVQFKPESKRYIVETVLRGNIPAKDGLLDSEAFGKIVAAEAGRFGRAAGSEGAKVFGMGVAAPAPVELKPEQIAAREALAKQEDEDCISIFESITGNRKVAEIAARGRVA